MGGADMVKNTIHITLHGQNSSYSGTLVLKNMTLPLLPGGAAPPDAVDQAHGHEDPAGASYYVIAVVLVYGMSIVALIASHIKRKHAKLVEDRQIHKYLQEFQIVQEKSSRDSYKSLKRNIITRLNKERKRTHTNLSQAIIPVVAVGMPTLGKQSQENVSDYDEDDGLPRRGMRTRPRSFSIPARPYNMSLLQPDPQHSNWVSFQKSPDLSHMGRVSPAPRLESMMEQSEDESDEDDVIHEVSDEDSEEDEEEEPASTTSITAVDITPQFDSRSYPVSPSGPLPTIEIHHSCSSICSHNNTERRTSAERPTSLISSSPDCDKDNDAMSFPRKPQRTRHVEPIQIYHDRYLDTPNAGADCIWMFKDYENPRNSADYLMDTLSPVTLQTPPTRSPSIRHEAYTFPSPRTDAFTHFNNSGSETEELLHVTSL